MYWKYLLVLLFIPALAFPYTVIRKDGRPFSGEVVREDKEFILLRDNRGIEVKFRVDQLDMNRTKDANSGTAQTKPSLQTFPTMDLKRAEATGWVGEPITVDFKDIDIKDFFRFISEISGMNLILDPAVKGSLTIKLTEVPWDQALDLVCRSNGLGYQIEGNVMTLKK